MRRYLSLLAVVLLAGCARTIVQGDVRQTYAPFGQNVVVEVVNNCSPELDIHLPRTGRVTTVPFGRTFTVVLTREMFMGQYGTTLSLTVIARNGETHLGSATKTFYVDSYRTGYEETWSVDYLTSRPRSSPGCTG